MRLLVDKLSAGEMVPTEVVPPAATGVFDWHSAARL